MPHSKSIPEGEQVLAELYIKCREPFLNFARSFLLVGEEQILEIYQECFIDLYLQKIKTREYRTFTCSLKTYLFSIGRNKILNYIRDHGKYTRVTLSDYIPEIENPEEEEEWKKTQEKIFPIVQRMKEPCNQLLSLYYWEGKDMKKIAEILHFKNEKVAKSKKYKCMQALKEKLSSLF
ncbi:MAG: sigma-70 family RNA polymerase sigma factor [Candidatus Azobacteroides sp.]|nr:sigma-70 family RNA polymerase sigma factor [Candidatus Azobacteroides sp.]